MVRLYFSHCIFVCGIVFSFTTKAVNSNEWFLNVHIRMVTASIRVVFQNREAAVNQDGNFNTKNDFHLVLLIIDHHCTILSPYLQFYFIDRFLNRTKYFESKYFNQTS